MARLVVSVRKLLVRREGSLVLVLGLALVQGDVDCDEEIGGVGGEADEGDEESGGVLLGLGGGGGGCG